MHLRLSIIAILTITILTLFSLLQRETAYANTMENIKNILLQDIHDEEQKYLAEKAENNKLLRLMQLKESLGEISNQIPLEELEMLLAEIPYGDVFRVPYVETAKFGESPGFNNTYRGAHKGSDMIPLEYNWIITPFADGVVEDFAINNVFGKTITIRHSEHVRTKYAHGAIVYDRATTGRTVKSNDAIMYLGSTGYSDGDHLHLELHILTSIGWVAIDPTPYLINLVKSS